MPVTHKRSAWPPRVTEIAVDPQTRVLVLESRGRELRELKASGTLTELQLSLVNTELDLLRIAVEHCYALLELQRISDVLDDFERADIDHRLAS